MSLNSSAVSQGIFFIATILLVYGLALEWKATTDVHDKSQQSLSDSSDSGISVCDIVQTSIELNNYSENIQNVLWRRSLIVAFSLVILIPVFTQIKFTVTQSLIVLLVGFFANSSVSGYTDYHMRSVASNALSDSLINAVNKSPNGTCTTGIISPF